MKKRKAQPNGASKRDAGEGRASNRHHSGREYDAYDSTSHPRDSRRIKDKGKRPMKESDREARGDARYDSYTSEGAERGGPRSVPSKGRIKEKDVDGRSSAEHGRRIVGGGGRDTTVSSRVRVNVTQADLGNRATKTHHSVNASRWSPPKRPLQRLLNADPHRPNLGPRRQRLRLRLR